MSDTVFLSPEDFIAEGTDRKCFRYPGRDECCIKVLHPERRPGRFWREIRYFSSLQRRRVDFTHVAEYFGLVKTNLGRGAIVELVLDDDGQVSKSLEYYLRRNDVEFDAWAVAEIETLKKDLYDQWIVFHDLNPSNILVRRLSYDQYRLVVIDGIGHNHFLPLASYSRRFARKKLTRVWNRRYYQWYSAFPGVQRQLKPYPSI